jgi:hypothetical protein
VASARTRALGGWLMSGVRRGLSSRWPSACSYSACRPASSGGLKAPRRELTA